MTCRQFYKLDIRSTENLRKIRSNLTLRRYQGHNSAEYTRLDIVMQELFSIIMLLLLLYCYCPRLIGVFVSDASGSPVSGSTKLRSWPVEQELPHIREQQELPHNREHGAAKQRRMRVCVFSAAG